MQNGSQNYFDFFMPTAKLAEDLLKQNQRLVSEYVQRHFPTSEEGSRSDDESLSLLARILPRRSRAKTESAGENQIENVRRLISERLYHYLSSLSESPWAKDGNGFPLREYVPDGMANMLGLSSYRDLPPDSQQAVEIQRLLGMLTDEFRNWLAVDERYSFVTPWLEIRLNEHEELLLKAIEEEAPESGQPAVIVEYDIPPARLEEVIGALANGGRGDMMRTGNGRAIFRPNGEFARSSLRQDAETPQAAVQQPQVKVSNG